MIHRLIIILALAALPVQAQSVCDGISPVQSTTLESVVVASGLTRAIFVTAPPGDRDRLFIVEQDGRIRLHRRGDPPSTVPVFLDLTDRVTSGGDEGLLGMAFDPDFATNGYFYVYYNEQTDALRSIVARFSVDGQDPDLGDPASELRILTFDQPGPGHEGGMIAFDSSGYLYVASGDGGAQRDQHGACGNGQNTGALLGKILRIDPHPSGGAAPDCGSAGNYTIPAGNAFNDGPGGPCDEIWALGLRNPWRFSIDPVTEDVYIGDVGQNCWEEINYVAAGAGGHNFGWRQMEGAQCFDPADSNNCTPSPVACGSSPPCNDPGLTLPLLAYANSGGPCSVTGGYVYRGCRMPGFDGVYFYGDFCAGTVLSFRLDGGAVSDPQDWSAAVDPGGVLNFQLASFGTDAEGELYVVERAGSVHRIVPPFVDLEVSAIGAADQFRLERDGNWTWEDLELSTMHPVTSYRVYRGVPDGTFECIHSATGTAWPEGDASQAPPGGLLAYLVTAVNPTGSETGAGNPPRLLDCPAP